jgi:antitoxin component of MazEF toxin-antitoxin module
LVERTLIKHGDGLALIIDKLILDRLNINEETPLSIKIDGRNLVVSPIMGERRAKFEAAMNDTFAKYHEMFKRLAEE